MEVALFNLYSYLWELETGQPYKMMKSHDIYSGLGREYKHIHTVDPLEDLLGDDYDKGKEGDKEKEKENKSEGEGKKENRTDEDEKEDEGNGKKPESEEEGHKEKEEGKHKDLPSKSSMKTDAEAGKSNLFHRTFPSFRISPVELQSIEQALEILASVQDCLKGIHVSSSWSFFPTISHLSSLSLSLSELV